MAGWMEHSGWKVYWSVAAGGGVVCQFASFHAQPILYKGFVPCVTIEHDSRDTQITGARGTIWTPLGEENNTNSVCLQDFPGGFELVTDFRCGPFEYTQIWRFHQTGKIEPWLKIHGDGVHDDHMYHVYWSLDFDIGGNGANQVHRYKDKRWDLIASEGWYPSLEHTAGGSAWRQTGSQRKTKSRGQSLENPVDDVTRVAIIPSSGDDAELYVVKESTQAWIPPMPRTPFGTASFPTSYSGSNSILGEDFVLWYAAHIHYSDGFPYVAGPTIQVEN